jgi:hypothetical protein
MSIRQLQAELERRHDQLDKLRSRREAMAGELKAIDAEIAQLGDAAPRRGRRPTALRKRRRRRGGPQRRAVTRKVRRRRAMNPESLAAALQRVLKGKTMSIPDAGAAVRAAGYKTKSANFRAVINQTIAKNAHLFKRVERGLYTAK